AQRQPDPGARLPDVPLLRLPDQRAEHRRLRLRAGQRHARVPGEPGEGLTARHLTRSGRRRASPYTSAAMRFLSKFVDSNDRELRRIQPLIDEANELEAEISALSDDEIRERFAQIRDEIHEVAEPGEPTEEELTHPDLERRRELTKARQKREQAEIQA